MAIHTELEPGHDQDDDRGLLIPIRVDDDEHATTATFRFLLPSGAAMPVLLQVCVGDAEGEGVTASAIRDLPLATWAQAAQARAMIVVEDTLGDAAPAATAALRGTPEDRHEEAVRSVLQVRDDLADAPRDGRQFQAAVRVAEAAVEYRRALLLGMTNPSHLVADALDVTPSAARNLVHRARQQGFLGPAVGTTPGEAARGTEQE